MRPLSPCLLALALLLAPRLAQADDGDEFIIHGFRAPSIGVEQKSGWIGLHVGLYPAIVDKNAEGQTRTTWFIKTGLTAYFLGFDTGAGRPSSPYVGVSLVQGLNNGWNVSHAANSGSGVIMEGGFRWAAYRGLDLRMGASLLVGFDGRTRVAPTPGVSWSRRW